MLILLVKTSYQKMFFLIWFYFCYIQSSFPANLRIFDHFCFGFVKYVVSWSEFIDAVLVQLSLKQYKGKLLNSMHRWLANNFQRQKFLRLAESFWCCSKLNLRLKLLVREPRNFKCHRQLTWTQFVSISWCVQVYPSSVDNLCRYFVFVS